MALVPATDSSMSRPLLIAKHTKESSSVRQTAGVQAGMAAYWRHKGCRSWCLAVMRMSIPSGGINGATASVRLEQQVRTRPFCGLFAFVPVLHALDYA